MPLSRPVFLLCVLALWLAGAGDIPAQNAVVFTKLHTFGTVEGLQPSAGLVRDAAGNFYGTAAAGGAYNSGTVFKLAKDGTCTVLHNFDSIDGGSPDTALFASGDGSFYGTTPLNFLTGYPVFGILYKISPTGEFTLVHRFGNDEDAGAPGAGIILGPDGNLYGTVKDGGPAHLGRVFRVTPEGVYSPVHDFIPSEGSTPSAPLVLGRDGNFYGTTIGRGPNGDGTVFSLTPGGAFSVIYSFDRPVAPVAALIQGADGAFYGTTDIGGGDLPYADLGTVFRVTSAGEYTVLHRFDGSDGTEVRVPLVMGSDLNFYGTATNTVFRITPGGTFRLLTRLDTTSGLLNALTADANGDLYGTYFTDRTATGQSVFFKLTDAPSPSSFFAAQIPVGSGFYFLNDDATQTAGHDFGFYCYLENRRFIYHLQLGFEYVFDASDGADGVYLYDFNSQGFFYTSPSFPYPYLYDFSLNSVVFHFGAAETADSEGIDSSNHRYFYVFRTGQFIMK